MGTAADLAVLWMGWKGVSRHSAEQKVGWFRRRVSERWSMAVKRVRLQRVCGCWLLGLLCQMPTAHRACASLMRRIWCNASTKLLR